jgi:hypothetical protein
MSTQSSTDAPITAARKKAVKINKPPVLFKETQQVLGQLEKSLGHSLISYWSSASGSVCHNDVATFYEVLKHLGPQKQISLFIKSSGGNGLASLRIVNLLRQFCQKLTVLVPLECASAATMMALGADEIQMGPLAYLTAVDTSITHELSPIDRNNSLVSVSQDELNRVLRLWKESSHQGESNPYQSLYSHIHPLVFGAIDRSSSLSIQLCEEILSYHVTSAKERARIAKHLNSAYPSHGYPIMLREAERIGLKVTTLPAKVNQLLVQLSELYSEMGQRALTDYDELNYHDHEIINILAGRGMELNYQNDKDWHYRKEERRWIPMNDQSGWFRYSLEKGQLKSKKFHIR